MTTSKDKPKPPGETATIDRQGDPPDIADPGNPPRKPDDLPGDGNPGRDRGRNRGKGRDDN